MLDRRAGQGGVAAPPVGADQSVAAQDVERLPYGLPADPEVFGQLPFPGQSFAGRDGAVAQLAEQFGGDPPVKGLVVGPVGGRGVVRMVVRGGAGHAAPSCW
ncbi:hypothetical protein SGLAM104S_01245 [Streptomyces glaucescens]